MSKIFLFTVDLISKGPFTSEGLEKCKKRILELEEEGEISSFLCDVIQLTKDGRIEIYAEDTGISGDSGEEFLSFIKLVEKEIDGFVPGSYFEIGKDQPGSTEKWVKQEYGWDIDEKEGAGEDDWDEEAYWEDEWEDWNEEWN